MVEFTEGEAKALAVVLHDAHKVTHQTGYVVLAMHLEAAARLVVGRIMGGDGEGQP